MSMLKRVSKVVLVASVGLASACADDISGLTSGLTGNGSAGTSMTGGMSTTTVGSTTRTSGNADSGQVDTTSALTTGLPTSGPTSGPSQTSTTGSADGPGPTTMSTTEPSGTSGFPPGGGDCCEPHRGAGCEAAPVQNCVCMLDSYCCEGQWDASCVAAAADFCGADCPMDGSTGSSGSGGTGMGSDSGGSSDGSGSGGSSGDCCMTHGSPGCDEPACEAAVCAEDSFCCMGEWDAICVDHALVQCPALCGGATGGSTGVGSGGDCCVGNGSPGCDDPACEIAVCSTDPFCCDDEWDDLCATHAEAECAGLCGGATGGGATGGGATGGGATGGGATGGGATGGGGGGDCCVGNGTPGCEDPTCEAAVCAGDMFCCDMEWDFMCADEALLECPVLCDGGSSDSGGGGGSDCCVDNGTPGCEDPTCEAVVCASDALCCSMEWDGLCADQALALCPAECGGGTGGGATGGATTGGAGPDSDCCTASAMGLPGCIEPTCEILVCALDALCCTDEWDALCAVQAGAECPICGGGGGGSGGVGGDCCVGNGSPGCGDPTCEAVVCSMDALCCTTEWDDLCADQAAVHCAGICP